MSSRKQIKRIAAPDLPNCKKHREDAHRDGRREDDKDQATIQRKCQTRGRSRPPVDEQGEQHRGNEGDHRHCGRDLDDKRKEEAVAVELMAANLSAALGRMQRRTARKPDLVKSVSAFRRENMGVVERQVAGVAVAVVRRPNLNCSIYRRYAA